MKSKKLVSLLLVLTLMFTLAVPAFAADPYSFDGTYDGSPFLARANCTTRSGNASLEYAQTDVRISVTLTLRYETGDTQAPVTRSGYGSCSVTDTSIYNLDAAFGNFKISGNSVCTGVAYP